MFYLFITKDFIHHNMPDGCHTPNDVEPDESETDSNNNTTSPQLGPT